VECFRHESAPAVAVCKTCGKAACRVCATDLGFAVACSETCGKEAADVHEMNQRGKKIYGIGMRPRIASGVLVWSLFTILFLGFGVIESWKRGQPEWFPIVFGAGTLVMAVIAYRRSKEIGLQC